MTSWTKVDPKAFSQAMKIMAEADQNDPIAVRKAIDRANDLCGVPKNSAHKTRQIKGGAHDR